ncbi:protein FAM178A-like [Elysia marginata]|uniref:Protein FAM178A-like n=1 Tax=Elysia marginata TaxID=1093978 RepID=A0AAV4F8L2_9GAST|nr:protein FAM178A-like [Elysia marginata]
MEDNGSMQTELSDSDEDLDVPEFSKIFAKSSTGTSSNESKNKDVSPAKTNRLDCLLSDHVKEATERARLEKVKEELLQDIEIDSQEENFSQSHSLASEHEDHLQQLDVKSSEPLTHPGKQLFHTDKFCCLFTAQTSPFACGFTSSRSSIDKILANTTCETLPNLLLSKALVTCVNQISDLNSVMIWLLNILSIHPSPVASHSCYINLTGILHQFKVNLLSKKASQHQTWCPPPLCIMRIFVNLGAEPQDLMGKHHSYPQDEIRKFLAAENDENKYKRDIEKGHLKKENVQLVLKVLATALQTQPNINKEDLNQLFFMIAKVQLDNNVNKYVNLETQECFGALLQCYSDEDWPAAVPDLCRQLYDVSDHHHNQVHLADLIPGTARGSFLVVRFSYICLRALLLPVDKQLSNADILNFKLGNLLTLSCCSEMPPLSPLAKAMRALLEQDLYKMISAIKLLDMCVGDDLYRSKQPWQSLEHLIGQINLVLRTIKDSISAMDLSKIKDSLSTLKVKWSLSLQDHRSKQRTIFPWLSQTNRDGLTQEVLSGQHSFLEDDSD